MKVDYKTYLDSREWAVRKESVRKRARGKCERCLSADMQTIHHRTHARDGEEPLADLLGVCRRCDEFINAKSEIDPMTDGVRVYLAGPITGTRWRDDLLVGDRNVFPSQTKEGEIHKNGFIRDVHWRKEQPGLSVGDWPVIHRGMRDGFDFTGPWFEDITGGHGHPPEDPHGWLPRESPYDLKGRAYVAAACRASIAGSDVVFCWIPSVCSPYGSVWELGYATALNKLIILYEQTDNADHWWLTGANADVWSTAETPASAWESFVATWKHSTHLRGSMLRHQNSTTGMQPNSAVAARSYAY